jgi:hypothetical protein
VPINEIVVDGYASEDSVSKQKDQASPPNKRTHPNLSKQFRIPHHQIQSMLPTQVKKM